MSATNGPNGATPCQRQAEAVAANTRSRGTQIILMVVVAAALLAVTFTVRARLADLTQRVELLEHGAVIGDGR